MSNFNKEFEKWKKETGAFGKLAMNRFVMTKFLEGLEAIAPNKYVFKGGNLLWHYIHTPRPTVDIDLSTDVDLEKNEVLEDLKKVTVDECKFSLLRYEEKSREGQIGVAARIGFETTGGAKNSFGIDVVLAVPSHKNRIKIINREVNAASLENIILDKVAACHRFRGGNTRMKDYDDLYRISTSDQKIRPEILVILSQERGIPLELDKRWIGDNILDSWKGYMSQKDYKSAKDLPKDIMEVFEIVNVFLKSVVNLAK